MRKHIIVGATVLATSLAGAGLTAAFAATENGENSAVEIQAILTAKLSAADAMTRAMAQQVGKVAEVSFVNENKTVGYRVSIIATDGTEHDFLVDAASGKVAKISGHQDENEQNTDNENDNDTN